MPIEGDQHRLDPLRNRDVDPVRRAEIDVETPQNPVGSSNIDGGNFFSAGRSSYPYIEIQESELTIFARELARAHSTCHARRELRRAQIADDDYRRLRRQKGRRASAYRVNHKQGDKNARIEIKAHFSPSSRKMLTS
jgi:hypothetical protein